MVVSLVPAASQPREDAIRAGVALEHKVLRRIQDPGSRGGEQWELWCGDVVPVERGKLRS